MATMLLDALTAVTLLGAAVTAGLFYAFSSFVMASLRRLPAEQGIAAMQSINVAVLNPWFFLPFFGTALGALVLAVAGAVSWDVARSPYLIAGGLLYLLGCIAVTGTRNVPLNSELGTVDPAGAAAMATWRRYLARWTAWNHVRTAAAFAAAGCFLAALG